MEIPDVTPIIAVVSILSSIVLAWLHKNKSSAVDKAESDLVIAQKEGKQLDKLLNIAVDAVQNKTVSEEQCQQVISAIQTMRSIASPNTVPVASASQG